MIIVTGATGKIASALIKQLDAKGERVRVLARDPKKVSTSKNVEAVQGDLSKPETLASAFAGADAAFIGINASEQLVTQEKNAFDAAKKAGVKHIVLLSVTGADAGSPISLAQWHAKSEANLRASGVGYTVLQPTFFMQNTLGNIDSVKKEGKIYGATKTGRIPMIDADDIAATAAAVLTKPQAHVGKTYYLTGPEPLGFALVAEKIGKVAGKKVEYVDIPSSVLVEGMKKSGVPAWMADDFGKMFDWFATDQAAQSSSAVEEITGRKPRTYDAFLSDVGALFK